MLIKEIKIYQLSSKTLRGCPYRRNIGLELTTTNRFRGDEGGRQLKELIEFMRTLESEYSDAFKSFQTIPRTTKATTRTNSDNW